VRTLGLNPEASKESHVIVTSFLRNEDHSSFSSLGSSSDERKLSTGTGRLSLGMSLNENLRRLLRNLPFGVEGVQNRIAVGVFGRLLLAMVGSFHQSPKRKPQGGKYL
jgi:hypothetical protein